MSRRISIKNLPISPLQVVFIHLDCHNARISPGISPVTENSYYSNSHFPKLIADYIKRLHPVKSNHGKDFDRIFRKFTGE